jgi:hypothetical protein
MQTAESRPPDHTATSQRTHSATGSLLVQAKVSSVFVVITDIIREQPFQMLLVGRNHMIEQVAPATLDPAFRDTVLPGTLIGRLNRIDVHRSDRDWNFRAILPVAIKAQESGSQVKREGLSQLLHDPHARRVLRYIEMQDAPPIMTDDEEAIEHPERDRRSREEIHCSNRFAVIPQKRKPSSAWFRIPGRFAHPTGDRSLRDIEAKQGKFAVDARRTPSSVFSHHAEDQVARFPGKSLPADRLSHSGNQPPVKTETSPVPPHDRLRRDDNQRILPFGPDAPGGHPEQFVEHVQPWPRMPTFEHCELLTQSEILQQKAASSAKQTRNGAQTEPDGR